MRSISGNVEIVAHRLSFDSGPLGNFYQANADRITKGGPLVLDVAKNLNDGEAGISKDWSTIH